MVLTLTVILLSYDLLRLVTKAVWKAVLCGREEDSSFLPTPPPSVSQAVGSLCSKGWN